MKKSLLFVLVVLLGSVFATAGNALSTLPGTITDVEVDGTTLVAGATNQLNVDRDQEVTVRFVYNTADPVIGATAYAKLQGYEFGTIQDSSDQDNLDNQTRQPYTLKLQIPSDLDVGRDYVLLVRVETKNAAKEESFTVQITADRSKLVVKDFFIRPSTVVTQGKALAAVVRVENQGTKTQNDVRVEVAVPELGVRDVWTIDEIKADKEKETGELYLPIPRDADAGKYKVTATVSFNNGHSAPLSTTQMIEVLADESKSAVAPAQTTTQPVVVTVQPAQNDSSSLSSGAVRTALEVVLAVLLFLLIVIGLVVFITKMKGDNE